MSADQLNPAPQESSPRPPTTLSAIVARYRQMEVIGDAIDSARGLDPDMRRDWPRADYEDRIVRLLIDLPNHLPDSDIDKSAVVDIITSGYTEAETTPWRGQAVDTLYAHWDNARQALDRDLGEITNFEVLTSMYAARMRDFIDLEEHVDELGEHIGELENDIADRNRIIESRTVVLADLADENIKLTHTVRELAAENTTLRSDLAECEQRSAHTEITQDMDVDQDEEALEIEET